MVISISFLWDMVSSSFRQNSLWSFLCEIPKTHRCSRFWRQERLQKELDEEKRSSWILASKIPVAGYWWYDIPTYTRIVCFVSPAFFKKREEIQNGSILPQKHRIYFIYCAARTHVSMERMMWKRHETPLSLDPWKCGMTDNENGELCA